MENLSTLKLSKICRVCLSESEQMYSVFSELYEVQSEVEDIPCIYEILVSISSIKVQANDGLPSMICTNCIDITHTCFKFQKQCNQSQIILDAYLKQCIDSKEEVLVVDSFHTLEERSKNDLVQQTDQNGLDPNDFLLVEEKIMTIKPNTQENGKKGGTQTFSENFNSMSEEDDSEFIDSMDLNNSNVEKKVVEYSDKVDVRTNGGKSYACSLCEKSYKYANSLRVHMRNHTQERPYGCKTCGKTFKQYGSLVYHQRSHSGEQPYACKLCGKRYKQSGTLTAHMRVHTGQRPFLCSICGRGFRQAPDLGYHMRSHTKEKPYMCNVCGKTMSMQSHLVQHMRIHTGERPYKCNVCEKAFPSSTRLKRHAIIHTSLKPYTCEVCSKSFNRMSSLKVHSKIHTDERSHVCQICNKGFIQAHALRTHLVSHSSELTVKSVQCDL